MDIPAETSGWTDKIELKVSLNEHLYSDISKYICMWTYPKHSYNIQPSIKTNNCISFVSNIFLCEQPINCGPSDYKEWLLMLFVTLRHVQPMVHQYKCLTSSCFRQDLTTFLVRDQKFMENLVSTKLRKMCLTWLPNPQMWNGQHNA